VPVVPPGGALPHGTWRGMTHPAVYPGHGREAAAAARCRWKGTHRAPSSAPQAGTSWRPPMRPWARRLLDRRPVPWGGQRPGPSATTRSLPAHQPRAQAKAGVVRRWRTSAARRYRRALPAGHWPVPGPSANRLRHQVPLGSLWPPPAAARRPSSVRQAQVA